MSVKYSVKYVDKKGFVYGVNMIEMGEEEKESYAVFKSNEKLNVVVDDIDFSDCIEDVEESLILYAQENGLIPLAVEEIISDPKRIFQGIEVENAPDFVKLSDDDFKEKAIEYFDMKRQSEILEVQKTEKVKELKTKYDSQINDLIEAMADLEPVMRTGLEKITCIASWERDAEAECMILVRKDTGKPLRVRPMTAEEKEQPEVFDKQEQE